MIITKLSKEPDIYKLMWTRYKRSAIRWLQRYNSLSGYDNRMRLKYSHASNQIAL